MEHGKHGRDKRIGAKAVELLRRRREARAKLAAWLSCSVEVKVIDVLSWATYYGTIGATVFACGVCLWAEAVMVVPA